MPVKTDSTHFLKTIASVIVLEAPRLLIVYIYDITNFWQVLALTSCGQLLIGFIILKYLLGHEEHNYVYKAAPPINQLIRRQV